jgi:hypothetical protein
MLREQGFHIQPAHGAVAGFLFSGSWKSTEQGGCHRARSLFRERFVVPGLILIRGVTLFQTKYNVRIIRI